MARTRADISATAKRYGVAIRDEQERGELLEVVAESVANAARRNARAKGGRRFWVQEIYNSIHAEPSGSGWVVGSTHAAAAHKQYGGTIIAPGRGPLALGRKRLAIPLGKARRNRWNTKDAETIGGFDLSMIGHGARLFLVGRRRTKTRAKTKGKDKGELLFALKKSVTQRADPWFPEGAELDKAIAKGVRAFRAMQE